MKFEEVFPAYKEGKTIKCNVHKFNQEEPTLIRTDLLDSEEWGICSRISEYMDILRGIPCVDFRQPEADDMFGLNVIDIMEEWNKNKKFSEEHELTQIRWHIPRKTNVHFVSDTHLTGTKQIRLDDDGCVMFYDENSAYQYQQRVNDIELIYLTGKEYW